jgi:proton-coupled amino acid transporter
MCRRKDEAANIQETEDRPLLELEKTPAPGNSSFFQAYFSLVNGFIGGGILGLPYGVREAGFVGGMVGIVLFAAVCGYTLWLLGHTKDRYNAGDRPRPVWTYTDLGERSFGWIGKQTVNVAMIATQLGFATAYLIFIGNNIAQTIHRIHFDERSNSDSIENPFVAHPAYILALISVLLVFLVCLRNLKVLGTLAILGNGCILAVVVATLYYGFANAKIGPWDRYTMFELSGLPIFYGTSAFAFTVHSLSLELHKSLKNPSQYGAVVWSATSFTVVIYLLFAGLNYLFWADCTNSLITLNLGGHWLAHVVELGLCGVLMIAYPLQMFPMVQLTESFLEPLWRGRGKWVDFWARNVYRLLVVALTAVLAIAVPLFGDFVSLVGSFTSSGIAYIFPPLFFLKLFWRETGLLTKLVCLFIITLGTFGMCIGTYMAIVKIVKDEHALHHPTNGTHPSTNCTSEAPHSQYLAQALPFIMGDYL